MWETSSCGRRNTKGSWIKREKDSTAWNMRDDSQVTYRGYGAIKNAAFFLRIIAASERGKVNLKRRFTLWDPRKDVVCMSKQRSDGMHGKDRRRAPNRLSAPSIHTLRLPITEC